MNILVACEESQAVTVALRRLGHNAYSCDIIPCSGGHPEWHIQKDVLPLLDGFVLFHTADGTPHFVGGRWDMIIAHPPCTYMSKAGARWMYPKSGQINPERLKQGLEAKAFFMRFLHADCPRIAVENPRPLKVIGLPPPVADYPTIRTRTPLQQGNLLMVKRLAPVGTNGCIGKAHTFFTVKYGRLFKRSRREQRCCTRCKNSIKDFSRHCSRYGRAMGRPITGGAG